MIKDHPVLSVLIVTWNSQEDISNCISSVYKSTKHIPTEIYVVDNKSHDATTDIIKKKFPKVRLLIQKVNVGFGVGNNIALARARGSFFLLLNPDTVINTHAIQTMMKFLESHPHTGVVGPEQFNDKQKMIYMFSRSSFTGTLEYLVEKLYRFITGKTKILFPWPHKTYMLNAGCLMTRADILPTRQWFDPDCFIYGEEHFLFRQVYERGWQVYFLRNCSIIHIREKSIMQTKNKTKFFVDSFSVLLRKSQVGRLFFR